MWEGTLYSLSWSDLLRNSASNTVWGRLEPETSKTLQVSEGMHQGLLRTFGGGLATAIERSCMFLLGSKDSDGKNSSPCDVRLLWAGHCCGWARFDSPASLLLKEALQGQVLSQAAVPLGLQGPSISHP